MQSWSGNGYFLIPKAPESNVNRTVINIKRKMDPKSPDLKT